MSEEAVFGESERVMQDSRVRSDAYHSSLITHHSSRRGFTLVEMLTVIGIIVLLVSILLPVVSAVRVKGHVADTQAMLARIAAGIEAYSADHHAYPGPLHNGQIYNGGIPAVIDGIDTSEQKQITQSENLVLGLLGGLLPQANKDNPKYDKDAVGNGPASLNRNNPKKYRAYMDKVSLSSGDYADDGVGGGDPKAVKDTIIPEFVDRFPDSMPILYMRAKTGATGIATDRQQIGAQEQYDVKQIEAYTGVNLGAGRDLAQDEYKGRAAAEYAQFRHGLHSADKNTTTLENTPRPPGDGNNYVYPYDLYAYLRNPAMATTPRNKDGYILVSAGPDRVYGTKDDQQYPPAR
jgi:prepilin-type N-terminal cleavage/methylation domain-containing protein